MHAEDIHLIRFLGVDDRRFVIPVYQRNYSWTKQQCKQLFDDLIKIARNNFKTHFLGSIVHLYDGQKCLVVDGQQRITTISLLLLGMYNLLKNKEIFSAKEFDIAKKIYEVYLYDTYKNEIKLHPIESDKVSYNKLFNINEEKDVSNVHQNYSYFIERIKSGEISIDELFDAIQQLMIVEVKLDKDKDDPQLIFESLNSTGLDLTEADKVRNFVLMKHDILTQDRLYKNYWIKIESNTKDNISDFIRDYLTVKDGKIYNKDKIYSFFKEYVQNKQISIEDLLIDLLNFSKIYKKILIPDFENKLINESLNNINKLEITVAYPFLLDTIEQFEKKIINDEILLNVLTTIESFVFRRLICNVPTNALNKIFATLARDIRKHKNYEQNFLEIFKFIISSKDLSQRFPSDTEFEENLAIKNIYKLQYKNKYYLLDKLENFQNKEKVNCEDESLSIEHIMPQTLTPKWQEELGENFKEVHEKYLDTLGNITLTGYNSEMQNETFIRKRDMKNGFRESRLYLNNELKTLEKWTEAEIINRAKKLSYKSLEIWLYPKTNYKPEKIDNKTTYLLSDDEFVATGKRIVSFSFNDNKYEVESWRAFMIKTFKILTEVDYEKFYNLAKNKTLGSCLSLDKSPYIEPSEIIPEIFVELHLTSETIVNLIRKAILQYNDISLDDIEFECRETIKINSNTNIV